MQTYPCVICKQDSIDGGSIIHGGMFFKMCKECLEDENAVNLLNQYLTQVYEEGDENDDGI